MKIFKQDLYKQLDDTTWNKLKVYSLPFLKSKESLLQNILKQESSKMYKDFIILYHGTELHFNLSKYHGKIKCNIKDMKDGLAGWYDYNTQSIILNKSYFCEGYASSGHLAYSTMMHEFRHKLQRTLVIYKDKLNLTDSTALRCIDQIRAYMDGFNRNINYFDFHNNGNLHISPYYADDTQEDDINKDIDILSQMFYNLNLSEWDAFSYQENLGDILLKDFDFIHINVFKDRYNCYNENDSNIIWNINESILRLYNNENPDSDLQANIMYDLCCIALLEYGSITESECTELLKNDIKGEKLQNEGFAIFAKDMHAIHIGDTVIIESIKETAFFQYTIDGRFDALSDKQLMNNPKLVLYMAALLSSMKIDCTYLQADIVRKYCHLYKDELFCNNIYYHGAVAIFGEKEWNLNSQHDL